MKFENFPQIIEYNAKKLPEKIFCIEYPSEKELNYYDFNAYVNKCCNYFISLKIYRGDIVSISLSNSITFVILYFACIKIGASINPLPNTLSNSEIKRNIKFLNSKLLITEEINSSINIVKPLKQLYINPNFDIFINTLSKFNSKYKCDLDENDVACYYYTSGTTTNPKCIMYSNKNMVSLINSMTKTFKYSKDEIHLGILPLGHTAIINYSLLPVIYNGNTIILCESFMKIRPLIWNIINKYKITYLEVVPTTLFMILNTPYDRKAYNSIKTLKYIGCGSAPLPLDIQEKIQKKFGIPVVNLYGLSETGPSHFDDPFEDNWHPGSIGFPIFGCECQILKDDWSHADIDEPGEIAIKGDNVFLGYYNNAKATKEAFYNGYFLTGDIGYKNLQGKYFFLDRKKDLIIKGGVNIFPGEIEEILYKLSFIDMAAVIGIENRIFGEEIVAFITIKDSFDISKDEIRSHCLRYLNEFKCPKKMIIISEMPTTPSGKILKRNLKSKFKKELEQYE